MAGWLVVPSSYYLPWWQWPVGGQLCEGGQHLVDGQTGVRIQAQHALDQLLRTPPPPAPALEELTRRREERGGREGAYLPAWARTRVGCPPSGPCMRGEGASTHTRESQHQPGRPRPPAPAMLGVCVVCCWSYLPSVEDAEVAGVLEGVQQVHYREEDAAQALRDRPASKGASTAASLTTVEGGREAPGCLCASCRTQMSTFSSSCLRMYRSTISGARYI